MPIRRIDKEGESWLDKHPAFRCRHPEHNIPGHMVLPAGTYEHKCPGCGSKVVFVVPEGPSLGAEYPSQRVNGMPTDDRC